jgi:hypothetical protein
MVIKERPTPVLRGEDAREFERRMKEVKPLPSDERERMERNFRSIIIINPESSQKRG